MTAYMCTGACHTSGKCGVWASPEGMQESTYQIVPDRLVIKHDAGIFYAPYIPDMTFPFKAFYEAMKVVDEVIEE